MIVARRDPNRTGRDRILIRQFFRRHNRVLTLLSVTAVIVYGLLPEPDVARGILIGGLVAVVYLDRMYVGLEQAMARREPAKARGRLFTTFLVRYGVLAVGLAGALWLSQATFWSSVVALLVVYLATILAFCRQSRSQGTGQAGPEWKASGPEAADLDLNQDD